MAFGGVQEGGYRHVSGNAVLSRWPIEHEAQSRLECQDTWPKVLLHVRTAGIDVYCVHLTAALDGAAVREAQVLAVDEFIRATADPASVLPPVLAGDFNAGPRASAIGFLRGERSLLGRSAFYQDAWAVAGDGPGITWDHTNPLTPSAYCYDARCDYVFVGGPEGPRRLELGGPPQPGRSPRHGSSATARSPVTRRATTTACSPRSAGRGARCLKPLPTGDLRRAWAVARRESRPTET